MRDTIRPEKSKRWPGRALLGIARETSRTRGSRDHRVCAQRARLRIPTAGDRALPSPSECLLLGPSILRAELTHPPREQPLGRGAVAERELESASRKGTARAVGGSFAGSARRTSGVFCPSAALIARKTIVDPIRLTGHRRRFISLSRTRRWLPPLRCKYSTH